MSKIKTLVFSAMLTLGAFGAVTFTSCSKEDETCGVGYEGSDCKTEVRANYAGDYKGSGSDNNGGTYTDFTFTYSAVGTSATSMQMVVKNAAGTPFLTLPITLTSNTAYSINSTVVGGFTYTGSGSLTANTASVTINQAGTPALVITFSNMVRI